MTLSGHGLKLPKINFHFFEIIENWTEMEWTFLYTDEDVSVIRVYFIHSIFNCIFLLKIDFYPNFQLNLISYSLTRFWILKHKLIMAIQFLKWKLKLQFSIFNFWKQKHFSLNPVFNKKFEIQITLTLKNKFPSENT